MFVRRAVKLAFLVALLVASSAAAARGPEVSPCHRWGARLICHASNQDCIVIFCPWDIYSDCEFN
jgi:Zn-finger protein